MLERVKLILYIFLIPLLGGLSSIFFESENFYINLNQPFFAPPVLVFPIAWTILYGLLGAFLYFIIKYKNYRSIIIYIIQLIINLIWSFVFFNFQMFVIADLMILIMIILTAYLIYINRNRQYVYLIIPYIAWLSFASILNLAIIILN